MAMLAERKRKQKWSLNPRGKEWSQDANKFGQKMLEKMGWQSGKGLGAKEDGIKEHIKISYKNDSKGMGYKESNDQWTEHESHFSALLESLTGKENNIEKKVISLEEKSQTSRARVHYKKFTRGKDLSRYSEKDLANIFGRKSLKKPKEVEAKEESDSESKENGQSSDLLVNAGSMRDYFKKKLPNFGSSNGYVIGSNGVLQKPSEAESETENRPNFGFGFNSRQKHNSESESEMRPSFGLGFGSESSKTKKEMSKVSFVSYISETPLKRSAEEHEEAVLSPTKKSRKDKQQTDEDIKEVNENESAKKKSKKKLNHLENGECSVDTLDESPKKKKKSNKNATKDGAGEVITNKSRKSKNIEQHLEGIANPAFNPMGTPIKLKKHSLGVIEESVTEIDETINDSNSKKKCTKKSNTSNNIDPLNISVESNSKSKKKKNQSDIFEFSNPTFSELDENTDAAVVGINPYEVPTQKVKKEKKKKKNIAHKGGTVNSECITSTNTAMDNPNFDETEDNSLNCIEIEENPYEVKVKKKKKSKKSKPLEIDNPNFDETLEDSVDLSHIEENPYEVKPSEKKKKKKDKLAVDNPSFVDMSETSVASVNPYEVKPTEKKKKKKDKTLAIDNPIFVDQTEIVGSVNPYEVKAKRKKKKTDGELGVVNPAIDLNTPQAEDSLDLGECDLMLNIISTPVGKEENKTVNSVGSVNRVESVKSRRSVRFSDVRQEFIIPNNDELKEMTKKGKKKKKGLDNLNFDKQKVNLDENVDIIAKTLDNYQAEIENDINEEKIKEFTSADLMVGEVGNPHGENEKLAEGTKLKFKYANMDTKTPFYMLNKVGAKKSYKHLIKGDILVKFKNTNLHEIKGYATKNTNKV